MVPSHHPFMMNFLFTCKFWIQSGDKKGWKQKKHKCNNLCLNCWSYLSDGGFSSIFRSHCTFVGYTALLGKASKDVRSVYFLSIVFLVWGQKWTLRTTLGLTSEPSKNTKLSSLLKSWKDTKLRLKWAKYLSFTKFNFSNVCVVRHD